MLYICNNCGYIFDNTRIKTTRDETSDNRRCQLCGSDRTCVYDLSVLSRSRRRFISIIRSAKKRAEA